MLTTDSAKRKEIPLHSGCYAYFPDALAAVSELSKKGNDKHNPGQPLHWSRDKSNDHADCCARHMQDAGPDFMGEDVDGTLHVVQNAWRALALAQVVLEAKRAGMPFSASGYPATKNSEFIPFNGGDCPVLPDTRVEVKRRGDGSKFMRGKADLFRWSHCGNVYDIIAYRVERKAAA